MQFVDAHILKYLLGVFVLALCFLELTKFRRRMRNRFLEKHLMEDVAKGFSKKVFLWRHILLLGVFIFSILALARPQWGFEWKEVKRQGLDILVVIDVSKSMLTQDVLPTRLDRAKLAVRDLLPRLKGDRIGLIAFAGEAFLVCPLTVDYSGFLLSLEDLSVDTIPRGGTALASAIDEALKGYEDISAKHKAVVIMTDGENLEGDPLVKAREAKEKGIKISTIGIGTADGELIRIPDGQGGQTFLKDAMGNFVKSRLNETSLKEVAAVTGGAYIRSSGARFGLGYLYDQVLTKMEKGK